MEKLQFSDKQLEQLGLLRTERLAKLYADVFTGPPWNEYTQCGGCDTFFGLDTKEGDACQKCGTELQLAYPTDKTIAYVKKELAKPNAVISVMEDENNELMGFAWGSSYSVEQLAEEKYRTSEMQARVREILRKNGLNGSFFYFSECGIKPNNRKQGISNLLAQSLLDFAKQFGQPVVMRTNCESPMVCVANRFSLSQIYGPIPIVDPITQTIRESPNFINFVDQEIPARVLFVGK